MATATASQNYRNHGLEYSLALHAIMILLLIFGLPSFLHRHIDPEPESISVEILPMAPMSNIKPQEKIEPQETKKPVAEKTTTMKQVQQSSKAAPPPPEEKPEPISAKDVVKMPDKPKEVQKPKQVQKPKKTEKKQEEKPKDDFESILNNVKATAKTEESKRPTQQAAQPKQEEAKSQTYDASQPLSMSETDAIRQQVEKVWNVPAGAKNAKDLIVTLHITLAQDGTVTNVELAEDKSRYNSDSFFQAAADSAMRAVHMASPLKNMPTDKYGTWSDMTMTFDPKDAL